MPDERPPDLSLFLDILRTLENIRAPYMIIGAFAGTVYGVTRVTYDIDIVVALSDAHLRALAAAYPLPRYYADIEQMRNCTGEGTKTGKARQSAALWPFRGHVGMWANIEGAGSQAGVSCWSSRFSVPWNIPRHRDRSQLLSTDRRTGSLNAGVSDNGRTAIMTLDHIAVPKDESDHLGLRRGSAGPPLNPKLPV